MKIRSRSLLAPFLACAGLALMSTSALAAQECKGKDIKACGASTSCAWIDAYTTKGGNKVDAYCRSKAKKVAAAAPPTTVPTGAASAKPSR